MPNQTLHRDAANGVREPSCKYNAPINGDNGHPKKSHCSPPDNSTRWPTFINTDRVDTEEHREKTYGYGVFKLSELGRFLKVVFKLNDKNSYLSI